MQKRLFYFEFIYFKRGGKFYANGEAMIPISDCGSALNEDGVLRHAGDR